MSQTVTHGPALGAIREARGLSKRQLSAQTGVSESHLANAETGVRNLSLDFTLRVAHALGVDPDVITYKVECTRKHAGSAVAS